MLGEGGLELGEESFLDGGAFEFEHFDAAGCGAAENADAVAVGPPQPSEFLGGGPVGGVLEPLPRLDGGAFGAVGGDGQR